VGHASPPAAATRAGTTSSSASWEGWHNTHYAFPNSARHGLRWWQIDASYYVIRALAQLGLARRVKLPSARAQARERRG